MAHCQGDLGDPKSALENYQRSASIREAIAGQSPFLQSRLAGTYSYMGGIVFLLGDPERAEELQRESFDISKKVSEAEPTNRMYQEFLSEGYYWLGYYSERKGNLAKALQDYREALLRFEVLAIADPKEVTARRYEGMCLKGIGTVLVSEGQEARGVESIKKGLTLLAQISSNDRNENVETMESVADAYAAIGIACSSKATRRVVSHNIRVARWKQARAAYQKSLDVWLELKSRGALTAFSAHEPEKIAAEVANCDTALNRLSLPSSLTPLKRPLPPANLKMFRQGRVVS
jgi:tetratricopeptide (TPR) repeat protein